MKNIWMIGCIGFIAACAAEAGMKDDDDVLITDELELRRDDRADGRGIEQGELPWCELQSRRLTASMPYHTWTFSTEAGCGDTFIDLASRDGDDTYVVLYRATRAGWSLVARNDDCGSGALNSCLEQPLDAGEYLVVASTYRYLRSGIPTPASYHLRLVCRSGDDCADPDAECETNADCGDDAYCHQEPEGTCGGAGECRTRPDICTREFMPVCGCDGRTYGNRCNAAGAGTSVAHEGACAPATGAACGSRGLPECPEGTYCAFPVEAMCGATDRPGTCEARPEACPAVYDPACGCDGRTYGNACEAASFGVSVVAAGECPPVGCTSNDECGDGDYCHQEPEGTCGGAGECRTRPDVCTREFMPVCGCDGRTYGNRCNAASSGTSVAHEGACAPATGAACGSRGLTECPEGTYCAFPVEAMCGATDRPGTCEARPEVCFTLHDPVCGCDGRTYGNSCNAATAGTSVAYGGACRR